jgi:hypothetical protein
MNDYEKLDLACIMTCWSVLLCSGGEYAGRYSKLSILKGWQQSRGELVSKSLVESELWKTRKQSWFI